MFSWFIGHKLVFKEICSRLPFCFLISLAFCLPLITCDSLSIKGQIGWASRDNRQTSLVERSFFVETEFRIKTKELYFYDYETIWWMYKITSGIYFRDEFLVGLYENNNTPQPLLLDLRKPSMIKDGCCDYLRFYYEELKAGHYLLRIAYSSNVIDETGFMILPEHEEETESGLFFEEEKKDELLFEEGI